jgi:hypothetical protein
MPQLRMKGCGGAPGPIDFAGEAELDTMAVGHLLGRHIGIPEACLAFVVVLGLALPFLPIPGEHPTRIAVRFRTSEMPRPGSFVVETSSSICYVLSSLLSYHDRVTGQFVQINCGQEAEALARRIHAERGANAATIQAVAKDQP